jgi:hypothetical protein
MIILKKGLHLICTFYHHTVGGKCSYHKEKTSIQKLFHQTTHDYRLVNEYNKSLSQESTFTCKGQVPVHAMKAYGNSSGIASLNLKPSTR